MKWQAKFTSLYLGLLFLLAFFFLAITSAQTQEAESLTLPEMNWQTLDQLLTQLEAETQTLSDDSEKLQDLLEQARGQLIALSLNLEKSQIALKESNYLLEQSEARLTAFELSWKKEQAQKSLELWIWRGAFGAATIGFILTLVK